MLTSERIRKFARQLKDLRNKINAESGNMYYEDERGPVTYIYMRALVWSVDDDCETGHDLVDRLFITAGRLELLERQPWRKE